MKCCLNGADQIKVTAEALAPKEGLELASECGYEKVILEFDCSGLKMVLEASDGMGSSTGDPQF